MAFEVEFSQRALLEIYDAIEYYSENQITIFKFNIELEKCVSVLKLNPKFSFRYKNMRAMPMRKFPYLILFTVENELVYIYSIFNTYQDPKSYPKY